MFTETANRLRSAAPLLSQATLGDVRVLSHGGISRRHFNVTGRLSAKVPPRAKPRERVEIPGLDKITYGEKMFYVPGLAKPVYPKWERDYKDPLYYSSPPLHEMPLYKEQTCYVFNQRSSILEGVRQALWLTKAKSTAGLPPQLLTLAQDPANQVPDQDERLQDVIRRARFWDTTEERPRKPKYCRTLLNNLLHLCGSLQSRHPALAKRMLAENYTLCSTWERGEDVFQVRGRNGLLMNSMAPLPALAGKEEVESTTEHVMETFYPISPAIDLQKIYAYKRESYTGFKDDYPYPHAHTLYFLETGEVIPRLHPPQLRAKMIMFAYGNALARAHTLYGPEPQSRLDHPITVQAVGTNGRQFEFVIFQLNTTDLRDDQGIKNQVWLDEANLLYDYAKVRPLIKKKEVQVPAGLSGYKPETFSKFLALYLHGAVKDSITPE